MKTYETVVILNPYTAYTYKRIIDKLESFMPRLLKKEELGTKKLAYPLREEKITEGYYCVFTWSGTPENVAELERNMRIDDNVLKFITVRKEDEDDLDEYATPTEEEMDEVAKSPSEIKSEQRQPIDALDVLLGFADYKKEVV